MVKRTRMAPSPTGEFHIGGIRTFLYSYAIAKQSGGQMVLRIEDTDKTREVEGALDRIVDVIKKYGLSWDEGPDVGGEYGPYVQSERIPLYKKHVDMLLSKNAAYYCFCTTKRLAEMRDKQQQSGAATTKYDGKCLGLSEDQIKKNLEEGLSYVVRLKVPVDEAISWNDLIVGDVSINSNEIDHQVLLKSDGYPTYHLAVVVDDHLMQIDLVTRGREWLPSTPKQLLLYKAFNWDPPEFAHLPNLKDVGSTKKMSKRAGDVHAISFLQLGYLPQALLNFVMFLGWNPGTEKEIYSLQEFVQDFSIDRVQKTDLVSFDRDKLLWLNGYYIRQQEPEVLLETLLNWAKEFEVDLSHVSQSKRDLEILKSVQERLKVFSEYRELTDFYYFTPRVEKALLTKFAKDNTKSVISEFISCFNSLSNSEWNAQHLEEVCTNLLKLHEFTPKEAYMTLRVALSGSKTSPPIFDVLAILGREESISRLKLCLKLLDTEH